LNLLGKVLFNNNFLAAALQKESCREANKAGFYIQRLSALPAKQFTQ
jgi:hypothetical protein